METLSKAERTEALDKLRVSKAPATQAFAMELVEAAADPLVKFIRAQAERITELEMTVADLRRKLEADG